MAIDSMRNEVCRLGKPCFPAIDEERHFCEPGQRFDAGPARSPSVDDWLEHGLVLRLVGDHETELVVAPALEPDQHLRKAQQELLERPLQRMGRRHRTRSSSDGKQGITVIAGEPAEDSWDFAEQRLSHRSRDGPPGTPARSYRLRVKLELAKVRREAFTGYRIDYSVERADVRLMYREPTNDEVILGIFEAATLVDVQEDHGGKRNATRLPKETGCGIRQPS